ncbi:pilus assembly protein [Crenobacter luteus]|uniref:PilY1 beta-propeller domain-containing protein n=1 Tax=Crenobacter luteus TaxID=1452487 RepID=A0A161TLM9_9NEIS|nr:PilC/PilY family type IV pilus protein [Crenobacter luteus]KZE25369.1 hypothetical protein AVW16_03480 [Crenobacter luteus]
MQSRAVGLAILALAVASQAAEQKVDEIPPGLGASSVGPNVLFALSIEFPTAGEAYTERVLDSKGNKTSQRLFTLTQKYIGYFDPDKCYDYHASAGYFYPVAKVNDATNRTCAGSKWSGNLLNWATMSALDIFRQTLTGGNRALGSSGSGGDYTAGDTATLTVLRRARVHPSGQNRNYGFAPGTREISSQIASLTPFSSASTKLSFASSGWSFTVTRSWEEKSGKTTVTKTEDFSYNAMVKVCDPLVGLEPNCKQYGSVYKPEGLIQKNGSRMRFGVFSYLNDPDYNRDGGVLRARMKLTAEARSGVATGSGGSVDLGAEWNAATGQFVLNPDPADASASGVGNSGVINYINKFGDANFYKTYDPAAELYYASLRYFRKKSHWAPYSAGMTDTMKDSFPVITDWDDPIVLSCQKNFVIYLGDTNTHGDIDLPGSTFAYGGSQSGRRVPNDDNAFDVVEQTGKVTANPNAQMGSTNSPPYLAGLAYWGNTNDLRGDLPGKQTVSAFMIDTVENDNPKTATGNTFYLAAKWGGFVDINQNGLPDLRAEWTRDPDGSSTIAAYSPAGTPSAFAQANKPQAMVDSLNSAFNQVSALSGSVSAVAGAVNGFAIRPDGATRIFRPSFTPSSWSGDVKAYAVGADGVQTLVWSAAARLNSALAGGAANRKVFSWRPDTRSGALFKNVAGSTWPASALQLDAADSHGAARVDYIRGERSQEAPGASPAFRLRSSLFGTVVNSAPVYIPAPGFTPAGCSFSASDAAAVASRKPMLAVGANDGMLHVLDADSGDELFAYLPSSLFGKLKSYSSPAYTHNFLVDGPLQSANICLGSPVKTARTVLVGSTGAGGRGLFALDVTHAGTSSGFGSGDVLWEFSSADDARMGVAVGAHKLVKLRDGIDTEGRPRYRYAVVVGNGLNSGYGASLFILYLDRANNAAAWTLGSDYRRIDVGQVTPAFSGDDPVAQNGLLGSAPVDEDRDGVTDFVYAGDINGNLWKFDLRSNNPAAWDVTRGAGGQAQPLFTAWSLNDDGTRAKRQPIVAAPLVLRHPAGGLMVVFGTGKLFSSEDREDTAPQAMYGLRDNGTPLGHTSNTTLLRQSILGTLNGGDVKGSFQTSSADRVDYGTQHGWYLPLPGGERVLGSANLIEGRAQFLSTATSGNSCSVGGDSWLTELSVFHGAQIVTPIFDTNGDGMLSLKPGNGAGQDKSASRRKVDGPVNNLETGKGKARCGSDGKCDLAPNARALRVSWREILNDEK